MEKIKEIKGYNPKHGFFLGVDSDGCAFDTMEIKHKKVFIPLAIKIWGLESIEKQYQEVAEFINLYSKHRGVNRFAGLVLTFKYLSVREDVIAANVQLPKYTDLELFTNSEKALSNTTLNSYIKDNDSEFLLQVLKWSEEGDKLMEQFTVDNPPYKYVMESLEKASQSADTMIISSASTKALYHEWGQCGLLEHMDLVAGQEVGPKKNQLNYATNGKYWNECVLLLGDAPGDLKAAKDNQALFYPIIPGKEVESWKRFYDEAFDKFLQGEYVGDYEKTLINEFLGVLGV